MRAYRVLPSLHKRREARSCASLVPIVLAVALVASAGGGRADGAAIRGHVVEAAAGEVGQARLAAAPRRWPRSARARRSVRRQGVGVPRAAASGSSPRLRGLRQALSSPPTPGYIVYSEAFQRGGLREAVGRRAATAARGGRGPDRVARPGAAGLGLRRARPHAEHPSSQRLERFRSTHRNSASGSRQAWSSTRTTSSSRLTGASPPACSRGRVSGGSTWRAGRSRTPARGAGRASRHPPARSSWFL